MLSLPAAVTSRPTRFHHSCAHKPAPHRFPRLSKCFPDLLRLLYSPARVRLSKLKSRALLPPSPFRLLPPSLRTRRSSRSPQLPPRNRTLRSPSPHFQLRWFTNTSRFPNRYTNTKQTSLETSTSTG